MFIPVRTVFMVVHVFSCLVTGIIPVQILTGIYNLERNWNIHKYSSLFVFLEFRKAGYGCRFTIYSQADVSLCWVHMPFCWFCHGAAQI